MKNIIQCLSMAILGLMLLSSCGGSSNTSTSPAAGGTATVSGTLTISGDAVAPTSVSVTTANFQDNGFSSGVTWTETIGTDQIMITLGLSHQGVAATEFPQARVTLNIGGQAANPTNSYTWFGTGKTAGITVDNVTKTATFTNAQVPGGLHFTGTPGATTSVPVTTTLTLNGTISY